MGHFAMSIKNTLSTVGTSEISVVEAVSIVIIAGPFGGIFGGSFTAHLVDEETTAIWLTTVVFAVLGLVVWSARS